MSSQLFLKFEEFSEILNDVNFDLSFVNSNILCLFRLRNRCWRLFDRFSAKESTKFLPESLNLFANSNDFISSLFNLNKRLLCLFIKIATLLNVFDKTSRKKTNADWVNGLLLIAFATEDSSQTMNLV